VTEEVHLDSNVPGNPAYHFTIVPPTTPARAGWTERAPLVPGAALATQCVHAGVQPDPAYGAVMPPIYQSSTFAFRDVCTNAGYDCTRSGNPTRGALEEALALLEHARVAYGLEVTYLELADLAAVEPAFRPNTRMVWIETPSNPLLRLTDIRAIASLARARDASTVVDDTFLSPALQKPFELAADLVADLQRALESLPT
jgi:cystathionine gamma-synthase